MPKNLVKIHVPVPLPSYGKDGSISVYVRDAVTGSEKNITDYHYNHQIIQRVNELWIFNLSLVGVLDEDKTEYVKEGNEILIFWGSQIRMKGEMEKVNYDNYGNCTIEGVGMANKLKKKNVTALYSDTSSATIINKLASSLLDGSSPWLMEVDENLDYGLISVNFQNENRLKALAEIVGNVNFEWWEDWKSADSYVIDYINVDYTKGDSTDTKMTLYSAGEYQNMTVINKEGDSQEVANYIEAVGYGDGINQLKSISFHATDNRTFLFVGLDTKLYEAIDSSATTLKVYDAMGLRDTDKISIDNEWMVLTSDPTLDTDYWDITVTRAQNDDDAVATVATAHLVSSPIIKRSGSIFCLDTSLFPSSGNVWIGQEKIAYSAKDDSAATLTLDTNCRGVDYLSTQYVTRPYVHGKDVEVYDAQYTLTSPESGSYISRDGIKSKPLIDTTIIDQNVLDIMAQNFRLDREDKFWKIDTEVSDPYDILVTNNLVVGDYVELVDSETGFTSGTRYEIIGLRYGFNEDNGEYCTCEVGNKNKAFVEDMEETKTGIVNVSQYYKGATNVYQIPAQNDDCTGTYPLEILFYIPLDAVGINKVLVSYKTGNYLLHAAGGITSNASTCSDIAIHVDDGNGYDDITSDLEAVYGTLSTTQEQDLDITEYIGKEIGMKGVKIVPTGRCSIKGEIFMKVFVQSV